VAIICRLAFVYIWVVIARVFMSWIPPSPGTTYAQIYTFVWNITEPVLGPLRRALPPVRMGMMALDLSPIIVIVGGQILLANIC
jgi:YggT family protein